MWILTTITEFRLTIGKSTAPMHNPHLALHGGENLTFSSQRDINGHAQDTLQYLADILVDMQHQVTKLSTSVHKESQERQSFIQSIK